MNKRTVLIVEDNKVNIQILKKILCDEYNVIEAENGQVALSVLYDRGESISVVLLDIVMPIMDGYKVLNIMHNDSTLSKIPVIVASGQNGEEAEVKALALGANDYVQKPYNPDIIRHRVANTIYLRETSAFINAVQKDELTGVYSKEYFYRCVSEILMKDSDSKYDLICCDIERFKFVNDLCGVSAGDRVLKFIAKSMLENTGEDSPCGRIGADIFICLVKSVESYDINTFTRSIDCSDLLSIDLEIVLRYGIYRIEDKTTPVNIMCDRACLAKDSIKGKYDRHVAFYDDSVRQKLLAEQFITSSMKNAMAQGQFHVFFQGKFDLKTEEIVGAEALVRWIHPEKGMMSPGEFIPLFEKNGFITEMDIYIWDQCCQKLKNWIDMGHTPVPLSVNVSRADIYNRNLDNILITMIKKYGLSPKYLHLEITETAYTENPEQIIDVVTKLKKLGFIIEMDDFGTGYSSLNMISELPIDILKLDMGFIQSEGRKVNNRSILSFIISLSKWLNLSVIAEGVETEAQVKLLQSVECECAQGYYYSKPLPQDEFEKLLLKYNVDDRIRPVEISQYRRHIISGEKDTKIILVLDSAAKDYWAFRNGFSECYVVEQAKTAAECVSLVAGLKNKVSAVVVNSSDISEESQSKELLNHLADAGAPALIIGDSLDEKIRYALDLGFSDYVLRPYNVSFLENRIANVIVHSQIAEFRKEKEIIENIQEMKKRAERDSLTGLLNRSEFEQRVTSFFFHNDNPDGVFIIMDVDNFKNINDSFGHISGDNVLCALSEKIESVFLETDIIGRMGGDELAVFVPFELDLGILEEKLGKLCEVTEENGGSIMISCSAGISTSPKNGVDYETLYERADTALLTAKRNGKGQYQIYEDGMQIPLIDPFQSQANLLLDNTSDAMFVCDAVTSKIIYINETACQVIGKTKKECLGSRCYQLFWDRCRNCDRCLSIDDSGEEFYEEDTFLKDNKTKVHIKARLGNWEGVKVKIQYLQNINGDN